jgi:rRNA-processing protein FCF1
MIPFQFRVDIISELEKTLPSYKLIVPDFVIRELEGLKKGSKGKSKIAAGIAIKIAASEQFEIRTIPRKKKEKVDDALIRISKILCTNDRDLREKAREKGITVCYLRQRKYLAVDGHLK